MPKKRIIPDELKIRPILIRFLNMKSGEKLHRRGETNLEAILADLVGTAVAGGEDCDKAVMRILDQIEGKPGRQDVGKTTTASIGDDALKKQMRLIERGGGDQFDELALEAEREAAKD